MIILKLQFHVKPKAIYLQEWNEKVFGMYKFWKYTDYSNILEDPYRFKKIILYEYEEGGV